MASLPRPHWGAAKALVLSPPREASPESLPSISLTLYRVWPPHQIALASFIFFVFSKI